MARELRFFDRATGAELGCIPSPSEYCMMLSTIWSKVSDGQVDFLPSPRRIENTLGKGFTITLEDGREVGVEFAPLPPMTVGEMVDWLSQHPRESKVFWDESEFGERPFTDVHLVSVERDGKMAVLLSFAE